MPTDYPSPPASSSDSSNGSSSDEEEPLTSTLGRLVDRARLLSGETSGARSPSPTGGNPRQSTLQRRELDEILTRFEQWSSASIQPAEPPDQFVENQGSSSKETETAELPARSFLERCVDVVDRITGGAEETFASEPRVTSLFSRADSAARSSAPIEPARQSTQRLQETLRKVSTLRGQALETPSPPGKETPSPAPPEQPPEEEDPKIQIHRPASMDSSASESTGQFLSRLLWGRKASQEEKVEAEVNDWVKSKVETPVPEVVPPPPVASPSVPSPSVTSPPKTGSQSGTLDAGKKPVIRAATVLNVVDNLVAQLRLKDDAEKERVRRDRDSFRQTSTSDLLLSPRARTPKTVTPASATSLRSVGKQIRVKKIIFSKSYLFKQLNKSGVFDRHKVAVAKIAARLDEQFIANLEAVRKAQPHPHYV
eukprot:Gregarina_sp_Pseudo_9__1211@NODE_17_length_6116_cov_22_397400_g15_i0_p3_GENE_NODE_17_length_6116_cov_22_397400_g15_i0NODE_17_length_6116_cov_22_397400_g15_i0_p3_ORF_typecomplete_len425_score141_59_NODE_17_length_6116_cov_22_397400_g15_i029264200